MTLEVERDVSEKSLRNETNHGSFGPGHGPAGHARGFGMEAMQKRSRVEEIVGILARSRKQNGNSGANSRSRCS